MLQINTFSVHRAVAHMRPMCVPTAAHMQPTVAHMRPMCVTVGLHMQPNCNAYAVHMHCSWIAYAAQLLHMQHSYCICSPAVAYANQLFCICNPTVAHMRCSCSAYAPQQKSTSGLWGLGNLERGNVFSYHMISIWRLFPVLRKLYSTVLRIFKKTPAKKIVGVS